MLTAQTTSRVEKAKTCLESKTDQRSLKAQRTRVPLSWVVIDFSGAWDGINVRSRLAISFGHSRSLFGGFAI